MSYARPDHQASVAGSRRSEFFDLRKGYLITPHWARRQGLLRKIARIDLLEAQLFCTEASIELATQSRDSKERDQLVDMALNRAQKTSELAALNHGPNPRKLAAQILIPNLQPLIATRVYRQPADPVSLRTAYENHRILASDAAAELRANGKFERDFVASCERPLATSFVLLAMQRHMLDPDYSGPSLAFPTIAKERISLPHSHDAHGTWSISAYAETVPSDDALQRIRVSRDRSQTSRANSPNSDIITIYAQNDLFIAEVDSLEAGCNEPATRVGIGRLMQEISPEATPRQVARLDMRTALIMGKLAA